MLVYANHLKFRGAGAEEAVFRSVGVWLKEQLGFGLHPNQLKQEGQTKGTRGDAASWLRIYATDQADPKLYAWVLTVADTDVPGRQWITELGLKIHGGGIDLSCVVRTEEKSALVGARVTASRPRVIGYAIKNIQAAANADLGIDFVGASVKGVGRDEYSYRSLLSEIERGDRISPIVLVSPTREGEYLVNAGHLQDILVGLAQVVQVDQDFNSYEMSGILGSQWSAWAGAVNVLHIPTQSGFVRGRFFQADEIEGWGDTQHSRVSELLAWVTHNTNISRQRSRIRPEGVMQLALRRRIQTVRANSDQMNASQLKEELEKASEEAEMQDQFFNELADEISTLETNFTQSEQNLNEATDKLGTKDYEIQSLKDQLEKSGGGRTGSLDAEKLLDLVCQKGAPTPSECIDVIQRLYGDKCIFLDTARKSAQDMNRFVNGRELLGLMKRLATDYRSVLMEGGDTTARGVFGKNEFAANESQTVRNNAAMRSSRTFEYNGNQIEMFRHLKIGAEDDVSKTIRVHFHWDAAKKQIIVGYCGKHLQVSSN